MQHKEQHSLLSRREEMQHDELSDDMAMQCELQRMVRQHEQHHMEELSRPKVKLRGQLEQLSRPMERDDGRQLVQQQHGRLARC